MESIIDTKMKGEVYGLIDQNKEKINSMHISLDIIPVGVKFLREEEMPNNFNVVQNPKVRSYCDVIRLLRKEEYCQGNVLTLDSNTVCKWGPAILGLKKPDNELEKKLSPIMEESFDGVFVFNINTPKEKHPLSSAIENPDTVTIVGTREILADIIERLGIENFTDEYIDRLETSALSAFSDIQDISETVKRKRARKTSSLKFLNWVFSSRVMSNRVSTWIITQPFKSYTFSKMADPVLRKTMAVHSVCMNTSVIPYLTQKGNVSYFDAGGIGWGGNTHKNMIMGLPGQLYQRLEPILEFSS